MILMIDNFDSFTYNLVQYLQMLKEEIVVKRNNEITIEEIEKLNPEVIVISPGPGNPTNSGISLEIIKYFKGEIPILGICLGHQTIGHFFGASIVRAKEPVHGKVYPIYHNNTGVFRGLKNPINVTRYHSLIIDEKTLPSDFIITAKTKEGEIMGIRHKNLLVEGVQFHPEAILTEHGLDMLKNFLLEVKNVNKRI